MSIGWMVRARRAGVGLVLVASLAAAGCDGSPGPESSPTPTPSAASSSSSSSTATPSTSDETTPSGAATIPAAARENSAEGAEAFVRYFVQQSAAAWTEPDEDLVTALSDSDCASCRSLAETARNLEDSGHRYERPPIEVKSVQFLTGDVKRVNVSASLAQHQVNVVDSDGSIVTTDNAEDLTRTFLLYWKGDRWVVGGIA